MRLILAVFLLSSALAFGQTAPVATCNAASVGKVAQTINTGTFFGTGSSWTCTQAPLGTYQWTLTGNFKIIPPTVSTLAASASPAGLACVYANNANPIYAYQGNLYACLSTNVYGQITSGGASTGLQPPGSGTNVLLQGSTGSTTTAPASAATISAPLNCVAASASGTAYTCTTAPSFTPVAGSQISFKSDVANTGTTATLAVDGATAAGIKMGGSTTLLVGQILASTWYTAVYDGTNWQLSGSGGNTNSSGLTTGNLPVATGPTSLGTSTVPIASVSTAIGQAATALQPSGSPNTLTQLMTTPGGAVIGSQRVVDVQSIGGTCNTSADDTTYFQAALTALGSGGGTILATNCRINANSITFPTASSSFGLTVRIRKYLYVFGTTPLAVPGNSLWIGESGGAPAQFQGGPQASIISQVTGHFNPIVVAGVSGVTFRDLSFFNSSLSIEGSNTVRLENVSATNTTSGAFALRIADTFWVWMDKCEFNGAAQSILIDHLTNGQYNGIYYLRDSQLSGKGIVWQNSSGSSNGFVEGPAFFDHDAFEGVTTDFLQVIRTNITSVTDLGFTDVEMADPSSAGYIINQTGSGGNVTNVTLTHCTNFGASITNGVGGGIQNVEYRGWNGYLSTTGQKGFAESASGQLDGTWLGAGYTMIPALSIAGSLNTIQSPTSWPTAAGYTIATGVTAPDGSATAGSVTYISGGTGGGNGPLVFNSTISGLAVGDWLIAGVWAQPTSVPTTPATTVGSIEQFLQVGALGGTGITFDNGASSFPIISQQQAAYRLNGEWVPYSTAYKVTAITGTPTMQYSLGTSTALNFWMPWMVRIPAGTLSDDDVIRYTKYTLNQLSNTPTGGGGLYLYGHQQVCIGLSSCLTGTALSTGNVNVTSTTLPSYGIYKAGTGQLDFTVAGVEAAALTSGGLTFTAPASGNAGSIDLPNGGGIHLSLKETANSGTSAPFSANQTALYTSGSGGVLVGTTANFPISFLTNNTVTNQLNTTGFKPTTIYSAAGTPLPTCGGASAPTDTIAYVSDATALGVVYVSGGSVWGGAICDGTNWHVF